MEARIATIIEEILRKEGGYVNHPADRGGPTNLGITLKTLSEYLDYRASIEDVKNLTPELAREIYYRRYFLLPRLDSLPQQIQGLLLDMSVHQGPKSAILLLQRVINRSGLATLAEDGVLGPQTQEAARLAQARMGDFFRNALVDERLNYFRHIVGRNPSQLVFLRGWERRAESFRA